MLLKILPYHYWRGNKNNNPWFRSEKNCDVMESKRFYKNLFVLQEVLEANEKLPRVIFTALVLLQWTFCRLSWSCHTTHRRKKNKLKSTILSKECLNMSVMLHVSNVSYVVVVHVSNVVLWYAAVPVCTNWLLLRPNIVNYLNFGFLQKKSNYIKLRYAKKSNYILFGSI